MTNTDTSRLFEATKPKELKRRRRHHKRFRTARRIVRRLRKTNWLLVLVAAIGVTLAVFVGGLVLTVHAASQVNESWHGVERVLNGIADKSGTELTLADFDLLQISVNDLNRSLSSAKTRTQFLRPFDFASSDLESSFQTLDAAHELTLAADEVLKGLEPVLFYLAQGEDSETVTPALSSGDRMVELLDLGQSSFVQANRHLVLAQTMIDQMPLAEVSPQLFVTVDRLASFHATLVDYNRLLLDSSELITTLLGLDDTKTYIILSQNNDELRPSGGYISTYGWIEMRKGRIANYFYGPTTDTTPHPPPADTQPPFEIPDWWIQYGKPIYAAWDGSWSADFPTTAAWAAWYFDAGGNLNHPVDGVIGIDTAGFETLLAGLEPVSVPQYATTVTADNFRDVIYRVRAEGAGESEHKKFLAALYYQILTDWQSADQEESAAMRRAVFQALREKHIMLYFTDPTLNQAADTLGWSGRQDPAVTQDYVMVVDANVNGSKQNRSVQSELTYDVEIQPDGTLASRLAVAYDYSARNAENDPGITYKHYSSIDYFGNQQVLVPAGSTLIEAHDVQHEPVVVATDTHTDFVTLFRVDYDSSERFQFVYTTPPLVETIGPYRRYKLLVQKQPGTMSDAVNVQVMLPAGVSTVHVSPDPIASYNLEQPILEFRFALTQDQSIEIVYTE